MKKCLILNDTYYDFHHGCETVMKNINILCKKYEFEIIGTNPVGKDWKKNKKFMKLLSKCDFVIVNGEGTIHHSKKRAIDLVSIAPFVKKNFNKNVFLINTTYQDNNDDIVKNIKFFDKIFVRESYSKNELNQNGIDCKIVPDLTFYTKFNLDNKVVKDKVGATDSVDDYVSKTLYEFCMKNKFNYLPALNTPNITRLDGLSLFKTIKFYIRKIVRQVQKNIFNRYDIILNGTPYYIDDYDIYVKEISELRNIYIGRYHSLCFALKTLTPFVAIKSNSHKIESMLEDINIKDRIIDINQIAKKQINDLTYIEEENIKKYINDAPIKIENMFSEIKNFMDKKNA